MRGFPVGFKKQHGMNFVLFHPLPPPAGDSLITVSFCLSTCIDKIVIPFCMLANRSIYSPATKTKPCVEYDSRASSVLNSFYFPSFR
jgi:hypothetical protein